MKPLDLSSSKFCMLSPITRAKNTKNGKARWYCLCDCGGFSITNATDLKSGHTKSCGCISREIRNIKNTKHGMKGSRIYSIWQNMRYRCETKTNSSYSFYGGRGISVCKEWQDFQEFYDWSILNGHKETLTIDRIDNNGNYCPSNCRWISQQEQARNMRTNKLSYDDIPLIRVMLNDGFSIKKVSELFEGNKETIRSAFTGATWEANYESN